MHTYTHIHTHAYKSSYTHLHTNIKTLTYTYTYTQINSHAHFRKGDLVRNYMSVSISETFESVNVVAAPLAFVPILDISTPTASAGQHSTHYKQLNNFLGYRVPVTLHEEDDCRNN